MPGARGPTRLVLLSAAAAGLSALLAACGHPVSPAAGGTVQIALTEYRVIPQSIQSKPGRLTLLVENDGRLAHTLAVSIHGKILGQTPPLLPGASTYLILSLSPGSYVMSSTLFSDDALGEYGTLTVKQ